MLREVRKDGYRIELDLSTQVLRLQIAPEFTEGFDGKGDEAPIFPTLPKTRFQEFLSASVLAQKAKQFDDGLYASIELAARRGAGRFVGKAMLLASLAKRLAGSAGPPLPGAISVILGAAKLGDPRFDIPENLRKPVTTNLDAFNADPLRSKPIGFYTWSDDLRAIFRQDRILQTALKGNEGIEQIVRALHEAPELRAAYEAHLDLAARLTNPLAYRDLRPLLAELDEGVCKPPTDEVYFVPPSMSYESELIKRLYGDRPIPEGFNLVDEMIRRIRNGSIRLEPRGDSGWYDHQTWALEPLVDPDKTMEAARLELHSSYREQLEQLFRGILALTRETHIKQVEIPMAGAALGFERPRPIIRIEPELTTEPLATYYDRRASSYHFLREVLTERFGEEALSTLNRLTSDGPVDAPLAVELQSIERLFRGACATACKELGLEPKRAGSTAGGESDRAHFRKWAKRLTKDPDVDQDTRMMVPVFHDVVRKKTKVWVSLGWSVRRLIVSFARPPGAVMFDDEGRRLESARGPELRFTGKDTELAYPVTAEVYVDKILDRDQFRSHCDRYEKQSAILSHLE